jgi:riboflavin kinase/FMN adenylyltransferase
VKRSAVTIGTFDGVHLGHQALVRACVEHVERGGAERVVALAFDPHPLTTLRPHAAPARLTTFDRKRELLLAHGADEVVRLEPESTLLNESAEEFVHRLAREYSPALIAEGADFRFGRGATGDVTILEALMRPHDCVVRVVQHVEASLGDQHVVRASSSLVRWLLTQGRADDAARVLGRPHRLCGVVVKGEQLGRTIGFPTANLACEELLPADGVYACRAILPGGRECAAAMNVGVRPTVGGTARRCEAHILSDGASGVVCDGLAEYGWTLRLDVLAWLREQVKFASLDALKGQIERDCARARDAYARAGSAAQCRTSHA